jgi:uncharacterized membrane protein
MVDEVKGAAYAQLHREEAISEPVARNIADIVALESKELEATTGTQRRLEALGRNMARPRYLAAVAVLVLVWVALNARIGGLAAFDPAPFSLLQGLMTLTALLTTTVVLIGQARQSRLAEQRAHLDLQVNLLTEQKVTKLIHLLEELRADLPGVQARHDPHLSQLKKPTDAAQLASALKELDSSGSPGETQRDR